MIYTIRCRRGHCGSQYEGREGNDADCVAEEAQERGWISVAGPGSGWLCPFDAPKEAADPQAALHTLCCTKMCNNGNVSDDPGLLTMDGWHQKKEREVPEFSWLCPACWKTTQPEPQSPEWEAGVLANAAAIEAAQAGSAWSIEEVKEIAAEVFYHCMDRVLRSASMYEDGTQSALGLLKIGLSYLKPESGESDADPRRQNGSDDQAAAAARDSGPVESGPGSFDPVDGSADVPPPRTKRDEEIPF